MWKFPFLIHALAFLLTVNRGFLGLTKQQHIAEQQPKEAFIKITAAANSAVNAVQLDEADIHKLIDQQLRQAGWETDSELLTYKKGTRPEKKP